MTFHFDSLTRTAIAANLVQAREAAGLTQGQLSDISGASRATIAQIETGEGDPRLSTIESIAIALGIPPFMLLLRDTDAGRLVEMVDNRKELTRLTPPAALVERLEALRVSRLPKENRQASRLAADLARDKGLVSLGAQVGAAIGTSLAPGVGTAICAFLGDSDEPKAR